MKWPLSKLYKITPPTRLHLISRDKPDSFSSRRSLLVAAFSYIIKKCIPPHPSRYSPFIVMRFARNLAVLANYRTQPRQIPASNHAPVARRCNRRGLAVPPPVLFKQLLRHKQVLCFFPCTPRASALRQARVSGGNLQNCAPSAACGGAMTQERNVTLRPFPVFPAYAISSISYSRVPMPSFSPCSRPACQLVSGNSAVK